MNEDSNDPEDITTYIKDSKSFHLEDFRCTNCASQNLEIDLTGFGWVGFFCNDCDQDGHMKMKRIVIELGDFIVDRTGMQRSS